MEQSVFPVEAVASELEKVVEVRMHYDHHVEDKKKQANELQIRLLNSIGAPMYVLLDPETEKILAEVGFTSQEGFLEFLNEPNAPSE